MDFIETLETTQFGHYYIELQVYEDEDGDYLYNVAIECDIGDIFIASYTLDIFESYYKEKAEKYYADLIDSIKRSNR